MTTPASHLEERIVAQRNKLGAIRTQLRALVTDTRYCADFLAGGYRHSLWPMRLERIAANVEKIWPLLREERLELEVLNDLESALANIGPYPEENQQ